MARQKLGEILIGLGAIDRMQLQSALAHQAQWGVPLARALLEKRLCTVEHVTQALAMQAGLALIDLDGLRLDPSLAKLLSRKAALQYHTVPLALEGARGEVLRVAMAAPASMEMQDQVRVGAGKSRLVALIASDDAIARAIARLYDGVDTATTRPQPGGGGRELELDTSSQPGEMELDRGGSEPEATRFAGIDVSPASLQVLKAAAAHHQKSEAEIVGSILEAWVKSRSRKG